MNEQGERAGSAWPECDFRKTKLSLTSQKQFAGIYDYILKTGVVPKDKSGFINKVLAKHVYDRDKGIYLPLSDTVKLTGKLPEFSKITGILPTACPKTPCWTIFFGNPLTIPAGYGEIDFIADSAAAPRLRLTNAGFLVVTAELDYEQPEEFEETISWTRGKDDDFRQSLLATIDQYLCEFKDYRGYSVVFSGRRSLHFHFLFSTEHLHNCPWDVRTEERINCPQSNQAALMAEVHRAYWDCLTQKFSETVGRSLPFDDALRTATQWRRMPWAIRTLEKDAEILGLPKGAKVPQIVIHENIRSRASKWAAAFCVSESFSIGARLGKSRKPASHLPATYIDLDPMLKELQDVCEVEWGPFPRPVSIKQQMGEWLFEFKNSEADANPSTIALGSYRKLKINGKHGVEREFYLPDNMTAQEWGNYLCVKRGRAGLSVTKADGDKNTREQSDAPPPLRRFEAAYKARMKQPPAVEFGEVFSHSFPEPIAGGLEEAMKAYRRKLGPILVQARGVPFSTIIKSGEGIGKTTEIAGILAAEAFDRALEKVGRNDGSQEFVAFAFRSRDQAQTRAEEFRRTGLPAVAVLTFWEHLRIACEELHVEPMNKEDFDLMSLPSILPEIARRDKRVFDRLEEKRRSLWTVAGFDAGITMLTVTHKAAQTWSISPITPAWHHPAFRPEADAAECERLANEFHLKEIVFDDPEVDDFLLVMKAAIYEFIHTLQVQYPNWRNRTMDERRSVFFSLSDPLKKDLKSFDEFNAIMRLDLERLKECKVDFQRYPYGQDNGPSGIYKSRDGDRYFVGVQPWVTDNKIRLTFLTTEELVTGVSVKAFSGRIMKLDFSDLPGVYPLFVPIFFDSRAKADTNAEKNISALAEEIMFSNPNATVIADGVKDVDNVYSFQKMKGLNGLEQRDISVILTWLAPDKYCELNIIGQWLESDDIIRTYIQDQLNQAVGRNSGFRKSSPITKTMVISTRGYYRKVISSLQLSLPRTQLFEGDPVDRLNDSYTAEAA